MPETAEKKWISRKISHRRCQTPRKIRGQKTARIPCPTISIISITNIIKFTSITNINRMWIRRVKIIATIIIAMRRCT